LCLARKELPEIVLQWDTIVKACSGTGIVACGGIACAFGKTVTVLADQKFNSSVFAVVVHVETVPRSLDAYGPRRFPCRVRRTS